MSSPTCRGRTCRDIVGLQYSSRAVGRRKYRFQRKEPPMYLDLVYVGIPPDNLTESNFCGWTSTTKNAPGCRDGTQHPLRYFKTVPNRVHSVLFSLHTSQPYNGTGMIGSSCGNLGILNRVMIPWSPTSSRRFKPPTTFGRVWSTLEICSLLHNRRTCRAKARSVCISVLQEGRGDEDEPAIGGQTNLGLLCKAALPHQSWISARSDISEVFVTPNVEI